MHPPWPPLGKGGKGGCAVPPDEGGPGGFCARAQSNREARYLLSPINVTKGPPSMDDAMGASRIIKYRIGIDLSRGTHSQQP
jgi:hypothetical protein